MIKIDMEMPRDCDGCPCLDSGWRLCRAKKKGKATITNKNIYDEKPEWCPLIEVKECKYTLWNDDSNTYECSECGLVWMLMEGTPMENQMEFCPQCGRKIEVKE